MISYAILLLLASLLSLPLASDPAVIPALSRGPWWRAVLYRVVCYKDELRTASEGAEQVVQISRACAGPGPFAANFTTPSVPAALCVYTRPAAAAVPGNLANFINLRVKRDLLELAILCRRFGMRHRQMPESLQELLTDGLLDELPADQWDGAPLRARLSNGVLTLANVNRDLVQGDDITAVVANDPRLLVQPTTRPAR